MLFNKFMRFNPKNPKWLNRDRFVLSNGHGCVLQYSLLHLFGYKLSLDDLKNFRQLDSITPGQAEALVLVAQEGLSYEEAAVRLGVPMGTVRSRVFRARAAVIDRLAGTAPTPTFGRPGRSRRRCTGTRCRCGPPTR